VQVVPADDGGDESLVTGWVVRSKGLDPSDRVVHVARGLERATDRVHQIGS
jgi:hypothetical protein